MMRMKKNIGTTFKVINVLYQEGVVTLHCKTVLKTIWVGGNAVDNFFAVKLEWHVIMPKLYKHLIVNEESDYSYPFTVEDISYNNLNTELGLQYLDEEIKPIFPSPNDRLYFSMRKFGNKITCGLVAALNLYAYEILPFVEMCFDQEVS
jgi:hypothetical protein